MYAQDRRIIKKKEEASTGQSVDSSGNAVVDFAEDECAWTCVGDVECPDGTWPVITQDCFTCATNGPDGGIVGGECFVEEPDISYVYTDPRYEMWRGGCDGPPGTYAIYAFWSLQDLGSQWEGTLRYILLAEPRDLADGYEDCEVVLEIEGIEYADPCDGCDAELQIDAEHSRWRSTCDDLTASWSGLLEIRTYANGNAVLDATLEDQYITTSYEGQNYGDGAYAFISPGDCWP
jgi:hypothetical protein